MIITPKKTRLRKLRRELLFVVLLSDARVASRRHATGAVRLEHPVHHVEQVGRGGGGALKAMEAQCAGAVDENACAKAFEAAVAAGTAAL